MKLGAVPEIVEEGLTGCTAESTDDMATALARAMKLDRKKVRIAAELRFSASHMAHLYERVYQRVTHRTATP